MVLAAAMKTIYSVLYGLFALLLYIAMVWIAVDDLWDAYVVGGWVGLVIAIVLFPATFLLFPLALGIFWGMWGQAVSMYLILPIIGLLHSYFKKKARVSN
jgi:hypothetical protein